MDTEEYMRKNVKTIYWSDISQNQKLSENFIRDFQDKVYWDYISYYQQLSEKFIIEFKDKVIWKYISTQQSLSENFIRKFKKKIYWYRISLNQKLSEDFIREFQNIISLYDIAYYQQLSENFIKEFKDKINWKCISYSQILSKEFIEKFKDKINIKVQIETHHKKLSLQEKQKIVKNYCKEFNLEYDDKYLYAFRVHDINDSGIFNKAISYKKNKYYRDWRCNLNPNEINSFGYGIFPKGNTEVKVKIEDIGCWVNDSNKLRVWGFKII